MVGVAMPIGKGEFKELNGFSRGVGTFKMPGVSSPGTFEAAPMPFADVCAMCGGSEDVPLSARAEEKNCTGVSLRKSFMPDNPPSNPVIVGAELFIVVAEDTEVAFGIVSEIIEFFSLNDPGVPLDWEAEITLDRCELVLVLEVVLFDGFKFDEPIGLGDWLKMGNPGEAKFLAKRLEPEGVSENPSGVLPVAPCAFRPNKFETLLPSLLPSPMATPGVRKLGVKTDGNPPEPATPFDPLYPFPCCWKK